MAMRGVHEHPSGLLYAAELISTEEEAELLAWCGALETEPVVMRGVASRRQVRHFGVDYDFSTWGTAPTEPIPDSSPASSGKSRPAGPGRDGILRRSPRDALPTWCEHRLAP